MNIRPATPRDIPAIVELARQAPELAHWSEETYAAVFEAGAPERVLLVSESEGQLHGFLVARFTSGDCELENIVVAPENRRQGIAGQLLKSLIAKARERAVGKILLEVRESNAAARSLYRKVGLAETGRRKHYYNDPIEDAILYTLAPLVVQKSH
ncbi:MAG TPA: ribosomal protein S18-alanine N-acetyltransferase [Terriglobales bacterium]|nr:ribosomal protein S18-alanine N-acetyltransferase [Terriglobales bacterium]